MKCLILCMGCNNPYYLKQWEDTKETWAKDILEKKYPDIDIMMYTSSGTDEYSYDKDKHILYVAANDSLSGTFEKTVKAFQALNIFNIKYDCILRTNCSTIINIKLFDAFIHSKLYNSNKIYVSKLFIGGWKATPYADSFIYTGNFILLNKKYINLINFTSMEIVKQIMDYNRTIHKDVFRYDDITLAGIINTYLKTNNIDPLNIYQPIPHQYLNKIYSKTESLYGNTMMIFIKSFGDKRHIEEYYETNRSFLIDFYSKYYKLLSCNLDNLQSDLNVVKVVEKHILLNDGKCKIEYYPFNVLKK